ncbi:MAG TPA: 3-hydroxyacyl-CoA dehydrogenase NAD-binding domain-containing protein [Candidatus Binatia bacterium]|nr:3-hydroxyacyl-CoA dehydrogenase NAD-binding domain-containing protein [Candidatus Binatia bacterium]
MIDGMNKVGVVGLGVMGFDIALLYAMRGCQTFVYDAAKAAMDSLPGRSEQTIERLKRRNRISNGEIENVRNGLIAVVRLAGLVKMDLVTEAVSESAKTKQAVYQALGEAGFAGILTTNTSSLARSTLLAAGVPDRSKFALTHFFNPVLYTQMVEVVKGDMEAKSFATVVSFLKGLGREPVETKDISGFVSNSILMYYAVMALQLLQCGARIEDVDQAAKELRLLPPFISFDSWKPSIVEDVTRVMFELRGDAFLRSSKLLTALAKDNPKFYIDQKPNPAIYRLVEAPNRDIGPASMKRALRTVIHVAAARVVELGESPATVDFVATEGVKIPQAPLKEIDGLGPATVLKELSELKNEMPEIPLTPPNLLTAIAGEGQTFFKNGQPNPWLLSQFKPPTAHASH